MKRTLLLALALAVVVAVAKPLGGADVPLAPQSGMLLLTNGELITGTITAAGDHYDVNLANGQIRIRRSQVALVAKDLGECYRFKRDEIPDGRASDYIELAEWCLRSGLTDEAKLEIARAKRVDDTHPRIALVEARLRLALEKPEPVAPARSPDAKPSDAKPSEPAPARRPLDLVVRNLPGGSVECFTNNIQPLLLNYCAGAGCHGSQSTGAMRLERISPSRYTGRKSTQRNLQSVLAMIDRENLGQSRLLTAPLEPHGGAKLAIFTDRHQSQYKQLVQWAYQVAGGRQPAPQPSFEERTAPLFERGPHPATLPAAAQLPLDAGADVTAADVPADAPSTLPAAAQAAQAMPERMPHEGRATDTFVPRDAFDAEIFNRRYASP